MAMLAVGGDNAIARFQERNDAGGDGLLAVIEVQEAANLLLCVRRMRIM
jgi:hypothetical protein